MPRENKALKIFFSKNNFIGSYIDVKKILENQLPEFCFVGRSNVGKSSIINAITNSKKLAKISKTPGRTQSINLFNINNKINLCDLPGYGYAKVSKIKRDSLSSLIEDYIINRNNLIKIFVLIDCKIGIKNTDIDMFDKIGETNKKFSIILTKIDKCSINFVKNQSNSLVSLAKNYKKNFVEIFNVSSIKNLGIIDIQKKYLIYQKIMKFNFLSKSVQNYLINKASTLAEALPYIRQHTGKNIVIKYGGHAMGDAALAKKFSQDIGLIKEVGINPIIVHGGGPQIGAMLKKKNIKTKFVEGLRITDKKTVKIVEKVLSKDINKKIVSDINLTGGKAESFSGNVNSLIQAKKLKIAIKESDSNIERILDLGFVGEPTKINIKKILISIKKGKIPVIAPLGIDKNGNTYNINADTVAGAVAGALKASKLLLLTDVDGILDQNNKLISSLSYKEALKIIKKNIYLVE